MEYLVILVLLALAILALRWALRVVTVFEYERGLKYSRGRFRGVLPPGVYWFVPPLSAVRKIDVRPAFVSIPGQEVLSADGVTLKASLAAKYEVLAPEVAVNQVENYQAALYLELQLALRQITGSAPIEEILNKRNEFGKRLFDLTAEKVARMGLRLLDVEIKDVMFPGELKKIFTQVVKARQEGLAALEKARGETAALRNLANAAHLVERNPALMQLRLLQVLGQNGGNTVVLGMPSPSGPIPIHTKEPQEIETKPPLPDTEG
jgi:regulator of protease activity HflC (stomatin/prohibitin superfamily)